MVDFVGVLGAFWIVHVKLGIDACHSQIVSRLANDLLHQFKHVGNALVLTFLRSSLVFVIIGIADFALFHKSNWMELFIVLIQISVLHNLDWTAPMWTVNITLATNFQMVLKLIELEEVLTATIWTLEGGFGEEVFDGLRRVIEVFSKRQLAATTFVSMLRLSMSFIAMFADCFLTSWADFGSDCEISTIWT